MRITIDTDDKGKVSIETDYKGNDRPGLFESTTDIPVIDAGSAPIEQVERFSNLITATEGDSVSPMLSPEDRLAQLPLNPLRAGAAAAYQSAANQRTLAADYQGTSAAQDSSIAAIDGGRSARIPENKAPSDAPTPDRRSAKTAKSGKKR
jgi:hypothetical protein